MAVPSYTTDLTDLLLEMPSTTGWTALGGGAAGLNAPETDLFIQGANCIDKGYWSAAIKGMIYNMGSPQIIASGDAVYMWLQYTAPPSLDTEAGGGIRVIIGSATTAYKHWYVKGNDTYIYGGWFCAVVDPTVAADETTGAPTADLQYFGGLADLPGAGPSKGYPWVIDAFRHGRDIICTNGEIGNYATFAGIAAKNDANDVTNGYNRWGICQAIAGGYVLQGRIILGQSATVVDFRDSNRNIAIANLTKVSSGFNGLEIINATSRVDWTNVQIAALGTISKGYLTVSDNADVNFDFCTFTDMGAFAFLSNSTINNTTFRRTGQITTGGATFTGCTIDSNTASSNMLTASPAAAALISGATFTSDGTGHAIEIGGIAANMTLTNDTFTGYAASDGSTGNEAVYVNIATGSMNLTISGGTTPSVRTAGAVVTVISGAVSATVTVKDTATPPVNIQNARVLVKADSGGPFPFEVTVTISNSGTTATVTHTGHGMATNDKVLIDGADLWQNNGVFTITNINSNSYSYTMPSAPGASPTGTIKATFVVLEGLSDVNGQITMSRVFSSNQPITGRVRKSSATPFYKTSSFVGTVNSGTGFSTTVQMISDE